MLQVVRLQLQVRETPPDTHGGATVRMRSVRQPLPAETAPQLTHDDTYDFVSGGPRYNQCIYFKEMWQNVCT